MQPSDPKLQEQVRRLLTDTGFYCRTVLGMDKDGDEGEPGKGGVRTWGPHQEFVRALDDESIRLVVAQLPRNSYKSSIIRGYIQRRILSKPNCSILLCMHDLTKAEERVLTIREDLQNNPLIRELYGDLEGPTWKKNAFTTRLRTGDMKGMDPTLSCCARDALPTGGHYDDIILDDIVDDQAVRTPEGVINSVRAVRFLMPLRKPNGKVVDVGTPYDPEDVHNFLLSQPGWHKIVHAIGPRDLQELADGRLDLVGEEEFFTWLSHDFLMEQLSVMGFNVWMSQYKLRMVGARDQAFKREQFQAINWNDAMRGFTGYLLTDVASSEQTSGCFSVLAYVLLDERLRMFIADLQVGHWQPFEFIDRFFTMRAKWSGLVHHAAEVMEETAQNLTFAPFIHKRAQELKVVLSLLKPVRNLKGTHNKDQRILRLQPRFGAREVYVVDTVPRTFVDLGKMKELWNPEGYVDGGSGLVLPSGELVDQFVRFMPGGGGKKDIPDALAAIDERDPKTGERLCNFRRTASTILTASTTRVRIPNTTMRRRLRRGW